MVARSTLSSPTMSQMSAHSSGDMTTSAPRGTSRTSTSAAATSSPPPPPPPPPPTITTRGEGTSTGSGGSTLIHEVVPDLLERVPDGWELVRDKSGKLPFNHRYLFGAAEDARV